MCGDIEKDGKFFGLAISCSKQSVYSVLAVTVPFICEGSGLTFLVT